MTHVTQTSQNADAPSPAVRFLASMGTSSAQGQEGIFASLLAQAGKSFSSLKVESARIEPKTPAPERREVAENRESACGNSQAPERAENAPVETQNERSSSSDGQAEKTRRENAPEKTEKVEIKTDDRTQGDACEDNEAAVVVSVEKSAVQEGLGLMELGENGAQNDGAQGFLTDGADAGLETVDVRGDMAATTSADEPRAKMDETPSLSDAKEDADGKDASAQLDAIVLPFAPALERARVKDVEALGETKNIEKNAADILPLDAKEKDSVLQEADTKTQALGENEDASPTLSQAGKGRGFDQAFGQTGGHDPLATMQDQAALSPRLTLGDAESFARAVAFGAQAENVKPLEHSGQTGATQTLSVGAAASSVLGVKTAGNAFAPLALARAASVRGTSAVEQISVQVSKMVKEGESEITIDLRPPELGRVQVKLTFAADNKTHALVTADSQGALDLLMKEQNSLARALADAGLRLDSGALEFSLSGQGDGAAQGEGRFQSAERNGFERYADTKPGAQESLAEETYVVTPGRVNIRI